MTETNYELMTVKELRTEAIKLGMPEQDAETFTVKAPLIATINVLKAKEVVKRVDSLEEKINPKEEKSFEKAYMTKRERMRLRLMAQPRIRMLVPKEPTEKDGVVKWVLDPKLGYEVQVYVSGAVKTVTLNGYKYLIPKGVYSEVPQQIADIIEKSQQQTSEAGQDKLLDRIDPNTGMSVREMMS